jgi:hypothetical protein
MKRLSNLTNLAVTPELSSMIMQTPPELDRGIIASRAASGAQVEPCRTVNGTSQPAHHDI